MPEREEEADPDRPLAVLQQLARDVVDRRYVVGIDRVAQAERVGEQRRAELHGIVAKGEERPTPGRDVRERPLRLAGGLARLAKRVPEACFVPLAIEYAFWDERRPNCLLRFGAPVPSDAIRTSGAVGLRTGPRNHHGCARRRRSRAGSLAFRDASRGPDRDQRDVRHLAPLPCGGARPPLRSRASRRHGPRAP